MNRIDRFFGLRGEAKVKYLDGEFQVISPGDFVRHPGRPDWGLGQIQSMIGHRITVNFENAGKLVIDGNVVELAPADSVSTDGPPR